MSKYINAAELIKTIQELKDGTKEWDEGIQIGLNSAIHLVENYPSADVVEVKHGEWIFKMGKSGFENDYWYECNLCGFIPYKPKNFCPNCGAKMEVEHDRTLQR